MKENKSDNLVNDKSEIVLAKTSVKLKQEEFDLKNGNYKGPISQL